MAKESKEPQKICDFCGKPRNEVKHLVGAPDGETYICNNCINGASKAVEEVERKTEPTAKAPLKKPREIKALLDEIVIGQEDAKRDMAIAIYKHFRRREVSDGILLDDERVEIEKSNILLPGPSGSGKTLIARAIARMLDVPFYVSDCNRLTQAGYVGDDVESILQGLFADSQQNVERAEWGIVFLDEFDKLARKSGRSVSGYRDVTGEGVQQALLKLVEGSKVPVPRGQGVRAVSGMSPIDIIDTTNILFIAAGSFAGIEEVVNDRLNKSAGIGFGKEIARERGKTDVYKNMTDVDAEEFGLIPEIVGRFPILTSTYELSEEELIQILIEPKNALCKQFRAMFSLDDIELQFDPEALKAIAQKAQERDTGARALRTIMEQVLKPYSYEAPDNPDISVIRITAEAVAKPGTALIMPKATAGSA
jgi:ATP-dependent Clp protease ATP-binding subunit ClpX